MVSSDDPDGEIASTYLCLATIANSISPTSNGDPATSEKTFSIINPQSENSLSKASGLKYCS